MKDIGKNIVLSIKLYFAHAILTFLRRLVAFFAWLDLALGGGGGVCRKRAANNDCPFPLLAAMADVSLLAE